MRLGAQNPVRVLVLTYNTTLQGYIAELAESQVQQDDGLLLEVKTFGKWATDLVGRVNIVDRGEVTAALRPLIREVVPSGSPLDFWVDEVEYALSRLLPDELDEYVAAKRDGRGTSPRVDRTLRRRLLDEVILPYQKIKADRGLCDWNDLALEAMASEPAVYDIVIVDEAQDFSANQVRAILAHVSDDTSVTFVLDAVQRIYPRYFTWAEIGIEQRNLRVYKLKQNHRNTEAIARFVLPLVAGLPLDDDGSLPDFTACVHSGGRRPVVVAGKYSDQLDYMLDDVIANVDLARESVAILQPLGGGWFDYARAELRRRGISFCELQRSRTWPTGPENVGLSTIHSAKGLEFDHVLLPGLNAQVTPHGEGEGDASLEQLRRLLAMGIGRATTSVMVGYKRSDESDLIGLLDPSTYDLIELS
jgi:superfamily I DNA/RNA helicase